MAKKSIPVTFIMTRIDHISLSIRELEIEKKALQKMLSSDEGSSNGTRQKPTSGFRKALNILKDHPEGLTIKQLVEKASEKGTELKLATITSQFSKESKGKNPEVIRKEDGRYVVA